MSDLNTSGETDPPVWEEHAKECNACCKSFTMTRRKHHCRACGRTFCQTCSHHKDVLPAQYGLEGPQRTCDTCHLTLQQLRIDENPDEHPPKPDPVAVKQELLEKLKPLLQEPEDTWIRKVDKNGVTIDVKKLANSNLVCVRASYDVRAPLAKVVHVFNDKDAWKKTQPDMLKCNTLETIDDNSEYLYVLYNVPVMDNRDVVAFTTICEGSVEDPSNTEERVLLTTSVLHPLATKVKKTVRARVNIGYTRFTYRKAEDGSHITTVTSIQHTDPRGMIPPKLVNATISRAGDQLRTMIKYMETEDVEYAEVAKGAGNPVFPKDTQPVAEEGPSKPKAQVAVV
ncbi:hypothetical protein PTSG_00206 [Salpingoeca rosetta]|uniref:FYVE-type domain-containing protein n=1 Tax=Salpingoeca rosetta (strain ATCC 50818 / BSB-021) TaxID=946362 RepID=F2TVT7_SALR5|nr:hypothetical protein, variant [Salpingoeca rosetta]XP_012493078.1 uncharacterized protein PTSG_00206 [Salpingoeca rosetta]EGD72183.1 hypothetical protein, variant [Salpingoeca rosetta]EGD72184.1 hypothetical protein PTSG_00206 [Salpingoeca rosetta]|eukprot:XP_004998755.1 hypothetical protein, variant [Salpingoeca rosetta]